METQTTRTLEEVLADTTPHEVTLYCWDCGAEHQFFGTFNEYFNFDEQGKHLPCPNCGSQQYYTYLQSANHLPLSADWDRITGYKSKPSIFNFMERPAL